MLHASTHRLAQARALSATVAALVLSACGAAGGSSPSPDAAQVTPRPTLSTSTADIDVGGRTLHVFCAGPTDSGRPTVIFEAGLEGDDKEWNPVIARLATTERTCAYDRAGIEPSEPAPTPRTTEDQVADLAKLLDAAGIAKPVILVGWSLGGWNAMVYTDRHPADVAGLVLVDVRPPEASARWLAELPPETKAESSALHDNRDEFTAFETDPSRNAEGLDLRMSAAQAGAANIGGRPVTFLWAKDTAPFWEGLDPELAARLDQVLVDLRSEMEAAVPGSTAQLVDASHDMIGDNPDAIAHAVRAMLAP